MSFLNKSFPMARNAGCLTDGETSCEASSRTEPKCGHQWFVEPSEQELFCNKRRAVEGVKSRQLSGNSNMGFSLGGNMSSYQPATGQSIDSLPEPISTSNIAGIKHIGFEDFVGNPSFVNLAMSYAGEYSSCYLDYGVRKVKVNQVRDSQGDISLPLEYSYGRGGNHTTSLNTHHNEIDNGVSVGVPSDEGINPTIQERDQNVVSIGQTCNKGDGNFTLARYDYGNGYNYVLPIGQPFNYGDGKDVIIDQGAGNDTDHIISMGPTYIKGPENLISIGISYNKADENLIPKVYSFHGGNESTLSLDPTHDKVNHIIVPLGNAKEDPISSVPSVGQNYKKAEGSTRSFGGLQEYLVAYNSSGRMISSYDLLMNHASSEQGQNYSVDGDANPTVSATPVTTSKSGTLSKKKEKKATKKISPNSFPSNVRNLLSTGILDGVPVKYVSWSREKKLPGIIKGTTYLCGCQDCNLSSALNAYEFERHAGCKTKHPNNHIYFENGKTIYAVVQELKSTPQDLLFEVITKVTGSPINQPNFNIWKGSYLAATHELARIYGKGKWPCQYDDSRRSLAKLAQVV